jgi:hypothetical protein
MGKLYKFMGVSSKQQTGMRTCSCKGKIKESDTLIKVTQRAVRRGSENGKQKKRPPE